MCLELVEIVDYMMCSNMSDTFKLEKYAVGAIFWMLCLFSALSWFLAMFVCTQGRVHCDANVYCCSGLKFPCPCLDAMCNETRQIHNSI